MKKISYILLLVLILPIILLAGCSNEKREFANFVRIYNEMIASNTKLNEISNDSTLGVDPNNLKHFEFAMSDAATAIFTNHQPYSYFTAVYKPMLKNALDTTYYLIPKMLASGVSDKNNEKIYKSFDNLKSEINNTTKKLADFERSIIMVSDPQNEINLSHYKRFLQANGSLIDAAIKLSRQVLTAYKQADFNALSLDLTSENNRTIISETIISQYYMSKLYCTEVFYYTNFIGVGILDKIILGQTPYRIYDYDQSELILNSIYKTTLDKINAVTPFNTAHIQANATSIKNCVNDILLSSDLFNISVSAFRDAISKVSYYDLVNANELDLSKKQLDYKFIIDEFINNQITDRMQLVIALTNLVV